MSSPLEQRYRRMLRLLPVGYRQAWEQDMVTSFLQSVEETRSQRLTLGERLSVIRLALRLRLNGSHATPRWALWYHVAYGTGLLAAPELSSTLDGSVRGVPEGAESGRSRVVGGGLGGVEPAGGIGEA